MFEIETEKSQLKTSIKKKGMGSPLIGRSLMFHCCLFYATKVKKSQFYKKISEKKSKKHWKNCFKCDSFNFVTLDINVWSQKMHFESHVEKEDFFFIQFLQKNWFFFETSNKQTSFLLDCLLLVYNQPIMKVNKK